jgi:hypothetical protein
LARGHPERIFKRITPRVQLNSQSYKKSLI